MPDYIKLIMMRFYNKNINVARFVCVANESGDSEYFIANLRKCIIVFLELSNGILRGTLNEQVGYALVR